MTVDLEVSKADLHTVRTVVAEPAELADGEVRLRVDTFGLTTNNITYAVYGDLLGYWQFFPTTPGWGRVPVWGFGTVVESTVGAVEPGSRYFGYYPMATHLVVSPGQVDGDGFRDVAAHRSELPAPYNRYAATATDPVYRADRQALQMLLYPLFFTSFVIDDFLADSQFFGAGQVVVSSASSKTALTLARCLTHRPEVEVVGLTSAGNRAFTEGLAIYDRVVTYDQLSGDGGGLAGTPSVYVDVAGSSRVLFDVHSLLGDELTYSMTVGGTHWDEEREDRGELPGPRPVFFFAPTHITKRTREWGRTGMQARVAASWDDVAGWAATWVQLEERHGSEAVVASYLELLDGRVDPRAGAVCTLEV